MDNGTQAEEYQKELDKLKGRKVMNSWIKTYGNNCWRLYIVTDKGKMVMTFCPDWSYPVVEHHEAHYGEANPDD